MWLQQSSLWQNSARPRTALKLLSMEGEKRSRVGASRSKKDEPSSDRERAHRAPVCGVGSFGACGVLKLAFVRKSLARKNGSEGRAQTTNVCGHRLAGVARAVGKFLLA